MGKDKRKINNKREDKKMKYTIKWGNRRFTAVKNLGEKTIKAIIDDKTMKELDIRQIVQTKNVRTSHQDVADLMKSIKERGMLQPIGVTTKTIGEGFIMDNVIENVQRQDISPIELGRACYELQKETGMSRGEIAAKLGMPMSKVQVAMDCYRKVPEGFRNSIGFLAGKERGKSGKISPIVAQIITGGRNSRQVTMEFFEYVKKNNTPLAEVRAVCNALRGGATFSEAIKIANNYQRTVVTLQLNKTILDRVRYENQDKGLSVIITEMLKGAIPIKRGLVN